MIEFEPNITRDLAAGAVRNLTMGGAAALALVLAAVILWRLSRRAEAMQLQRERDRRLAALGEMAAVLAHEMRNPLASMKGHAQLLAETLGEGSRERAKADRVVQEAVRLERLSGDLLSFVQARKIQRGEAAPAAVLSRAALEVDPERCDLDIDAAPTRWYFDATMIEQVLANLLRNALQASGNHGRVEAGAAVEGNQLVFTVRDFGPGIPPADAERIFEPFHTTRIHGTGLGLAVARQIVALHGGTLTTTNHPQGGAVFRVQLPPR